MMLEESRGRLNLGSLLSIVPCLLLGCGDPVREEKIETLGPEMAGIPVGPSHRPGQPCNDCHHDDGNAAPFSIAGTVYQYRDEPFPLADAFVRFMDAGGTEHFAATNCAGNFFVRPADFEPLYPMRVSVIFGRLEVEMQSFVHRDGSCATCHPTRPGERSVGQVYLLPERGGLIQYEFPQVMCP